MSLGRLGDAALAYAAKGWPVFPCEVRGKVPTVARGFHAATVDAAQIRAWWGAELAANIGLPLRPGILVLDVDARHAGHASLADLECQHGRLPRTLAATTPSGGLHMFLRAPEDATVRQTAGELGAGIDTRISGKGYVLVAPSVGANGQPYRWHVRAPIAEAPPWLVALLAPAPVPERSTYAPPSIGDQARAQRYAMAALAGEAEAVAATSEGGRNHRLFAAWARCSRDADVAPFLSRELVVRELTAAARACGLADAEIARTLRDGLRATRAA